MPELASVIGAEYSFARHEHAELGAGLDEIHTVADAVGRLAATDAAHAVLGVRGWLATVLIPHAEWEDSVIYPEIERVTGTKWATKLMRFEHLQIERAGQLLDGDVELLRDGLLTHAQLCEIRAHLLGLEALLRAHIEREELFLLPVIEER
jgi:hemerythrin-like domain-containing protein